MDKVSIIIPTYRRNDCLDRAINSCVFQTYKNIEIIVVDDNNDKDEFRIINEQKMKKYQKYENIIYIKHKKNMNGAAARNTGIKAASGEYITFLDDDDFFLKNRIEKLVSYMDSHKEYGCIYSGVAFVKKEKIIDCIHEFKGGNLKLDLLYQKSFFGTGSNMFFRRKIIEKVGLFDEKFTRHQDIEYMIRFFDFSKICYDKNILVVKVLDDTSNHPNIDKMLEVKKLFLQKFHGDIDKYPNEKTNIIKKNYEQLLYFKKIRYYDRKKVYCALDEIHMITNTQKILFEIKVKLLPIKKFLKNILNSYKIPKVIEDSVINEVNLIMNNKWEVEDNVKS